MLATPHLFLFFFFNDTATTEIYTLSLHDALPIFLSRRVNGGSQPVSAARGQTVGRLDSTARSAFVLMCGLVMIGSGILSDRKSTRLNSSHANISYAVFCLKKKKIST